MSIAVFLKEKETLKRACISKHLLNGFQDVRWFAPDRTPHPLDVLFSEHDAPVAPHDYGLVVIDRDDRWVGSCQGFMAMGLIDPRGSAEEVRRWRGLNLDKTLSEHEQKDWPVIFSDMRLRLHLLALAHEAGATRRLRVGRWSEDPQWQHMGDLGLFDMETAIEWLDARREELTGGDCVMTKCSFEFAPRGWVIEDHSPEAEGVRQFGRVLASRGLLPAMDDQAVDDWWAARFG